MPPERRNYLWLELQALLVVPKLISEPPRREMKLDRGHWRNDMRLRSVEGDRDFRVFMRKSEEFPENFSIGLTYRPNDGGEEIPLLRCNGPHGEFNRTFDAEHRTIRSMFTGQPRRRSLPPRVRKVTQKPARSLRPTKRRCSILLEPCTSKMQQSIFRMWHRGASGLNKKTIRYEWSGVPQAVFQRPSCLSA